MQISSYMKALCLSKCSLPRPLRLFGGIHLSCISYQSWSTCLHIGFSLVSAQYFLSMFGFSDFGWTKAHFTVFFVLPYMCFPPSNAVVSFKAVIPCIGTWISSTSSALQITTRAPCSATFLMLAMFGNLDSVASKRLQGRDNCAHGDLGGVQTTIAPSVGAGDLETLYESILLP